MEMMDRKSQGDQHYQSKLKSKLKSKSKLKLKKIAIRRRRKSESPPPKSKRNRSGRNKGFHKCCPFCRPEIRIRIYRQHVAQRTCQNYIKYGETEPLF